MAVHTRSKGSARAEPTGPSTATDEAPQGSGSHVTSDDRKDTSTGSGSNSNPAVVPKVASMGSQYWSWVQQPEPGHPRFFTQPLLEACSKTPWWVVPLLWLPIFTACVHHTTHTLGAPLIACIPWLLAGIVAWQLLEYTVHRFVFHARLTSPLGITFHFLFHGCHHKYPMDRLRLVFPPVPASALVGAVFVVLRATLPPQHALPMFAGMGYGYVAYDCLHYALHHHGQGLPGGMLQDLRQRHMHHHYKNSCTGYGISSVVFDVLLGTDCQVF